MGEGESRYADNSGIRLHYRIAGAGPALVLLHGFPDYWGGWRRQFVELAARYTIIAPDMRGFNLSDRPNGIDHYDIRHLAQDVLAVLDDAGMGRVAVAGHDLGGMVAWWLACRHPDHVSRLAVLAAPHPIDFLKGRTDAARPSPDYLDRLAGEGDAGEWTPERLSFWVKESGEREEHIEAMRRTDIAAIRNIYRANLSKRSPFPGMPDFRVSQPTLAILSEDDRFVPPRLFDHIGDHVDGRLEVHRIAQGGHFMHYDRAESVNPLLLQWAATP